MKEKIVDQHTLRTQVQKWKASGKKIVSTSGCFDIIHPGHIAYLEEAKEKGDILIVLLNADSSVRKLKGASRPVVGEADRAAVVAGLASVDAVCIFGELTPCGMILELQPDIIVKGGDYAGAHIPEMDAAATYGGSVEYVSVVEGKSSTSIISRLMQTKQEMKQQQQSKKESQ
ncbi:MAG: adenylyltransferase/cytidyltransferase family protein [Eubacterium sp.]|nr:adenylyltransferase/cytidyltransferase family protein [Eubacterium sp.]